MKMVVPCLLAFFACGRKPVGVAVSPSNACPPPTPPIRNLVDSLDANPDPLHLDVTPSVLALINEGVPGACHVVDRLQVDSSETRMHAQRVLEGVLAVSLGFRSGRGFRDEYGEEAAIQISAAIGYAYDAPADARRAAAARWRHWLERLPAPVVEDPTLDEMKAALDAVRPQLERCGLPMDLKVTFGNSGAATSVVGTASTSMTYRACLSAATKTVKVRPFVRTSVWTRYPW